jgi:methylated-DNA-[protein]-cysteine S-methyltransferase
VNAVWRERIEFALAQESPDALLDLARSQTGRVLRYLAGRLCSTDEEEKWQAVRAIGVVVGDPQLLSRQKAADLLRRFFWALNDESGAVPWGVPEAIGEILAVRPELQEAFLPMLCSLLTDQDMVQSGSIERGVVWALGRVGPPVAQRTPGAVEALRAAAATHPDPETRQVAALSLAALANADASP